MPPPVPRTTALSREHAARTAAEQQLAQQQRELVREVQQARAAGEAALRQLQRQADAQLRALESERDSAAEQAAAAQQLATEHRASLQRLQAELSMRLSNLQLRAEVAEQLAQRRDAEVQATHEQLRSQAVQIAVSGA